MIAIGEILVSEDILENQFVCDLAKCKGACCVEGDFGAPLEEDEIGILTKDLDKILPFLNPEARQFLVDQPLYLYYPALGSNGTALLENGACVFTVWQDGIAQCGIELAHRAGQIGLQKPISCHLYPIRVEENPDLGFTAVNYDHWEICDQACKLGKRLQIPVYVFVRNALERKFGKPFYNQLHEIARNRENE